MADALADYILKLSEAAGNTHFSDDRPLYRAYLADAAVMLALVVSGAKPEEIHDAVMGHERLWGNTWVQDDVYKKPSAAFEAIRKQLHAT